MGKSKKKSKQKTARNSLILFVVPTIFYLSSTFLLVVGFILLGLGGIRVDDLPILIIPSLISVVSLLLIKSTGISVNKTLIAWFNVNFPNVFP